MPTNHPPRARLARGALTAEAIARAALSLLDERGAAGFTLPALGRALGADQTAVYRHFANKDEIVIAVAELLLDEVMEGFVPTDCWRRTLAELSRRIRRVYTRHPGAGSLAASRTTGKAGEKRLVEYFLDAVVRAGFSGRDVALYYRVAADFSLLWAGGHASYLALAPGQQLIDESSWSREYFTADPKVYPRTSANRDHLVDVGFDEIFETALTLMLDGIAARAPRPCTCGDPAHVAAPHPSTGADGSPSTAAATRP